MAEETKRIHAIISKELIDKVMCLGYPTITEAVIRGLERLITDECSTNTKDNAEKFNLELLDQSKQRIESLEDQLKVKDIQIEKLTETLQAQAVQVQTLIHQQKAIEAPGTKKPWWQFW
jgi:TolA-binding protein